MSRAACTAVISSLSTASVAALLMVSGFSGPISASSGVTGVPSAVMVEAARPASVGTAPASSAEGEAPSHKVSFFANEPELDNSGWAACPDPIAWTVDMRALSAREGPRQLASLRWAFSQWARVTGLTFRFAGESAMAYDESTFTLASADGEAPTDRLIRVSFIPDASSRLLGGAIVGQGGPSAVFADTRVIVGATAIFRTDFVVGASTRSVRSLYLHELGHALGLAHATNPRDVMYPIVSGQTRLGPGDISGVSSLTKPCA